MLPLQNKVGILFQSRKINYMANRIEHSGIIESIGVDCIRVRIVQTSACSTCKVSGHCNASESKEKTVDIFNVSGAESLHVGDEVTVSASMDVAGRALLYGFGIPFMVLVGVLFAMMWLTGNEGLSALCGLVALLPYYIIIYMFRERLRKQLAFRIDS